MPAKAGIQSFQDLLDPGFRRGDNNRQIFKGLKTGYRIGPAPYLIRGPA